MGNRSACGSIKFDTMDLLKTENIPTAGGLTINTRTWLGELLAQQLLSSSATL